MNLFHKVPTEYFKVSTAKSSARYDDWLPSYGHFAYFVFNLCYAQIQQNGHNSATNCLISLKFRLQIVLKILLAPFETILSSK